jgi:DNA-binding NtrC family response regulator
VVERSVLLAQQEEISATDLQLARPAVPAQEGGGELAGMTLEQAEVWFIQRALERHDGNAAEAAKALGLSRSALYRRLGRKEPT